MRYFKYEKNIVIIRLLWVPVSLSITNENTSGWPVDVDAAIIRDLLGRTALPCHQLVLNKPPVSSGYIQSTVTGYIQSSVHRAVDRDQLLSWFPATWSPVL